MTRLVVYLIAIAAVASGLAWLADRPGTLLITWQEREYETSVFRAVVLLTFLIGLSIFGWGVFKQIWRSPAAVGQYFTRRRQARGLDALSSGIIAIGAGDRALATRYAQQARKALPNEPLTLLLRAQAAQLSGDKGTARRIFEAMLGAPDTEQLGLRGLYLEAEREGEREAARQFAKRALDLNPKLAWPIDALFELQCKARDWDAALETLAIGRRNGHIEKADADRRRAVLLTGQAQAAEDENPNRAMELATEANTLAPDLVPAAEIAGRLLASRGQTAKVARIIERTWKAAPHPDLALVYAFARPGDSPRDRLERIKRLARMTPHAAEGPIAVASAAIEAREWSEARDALAPLLEGQLSRRVCTLMAQIEGGEKNDVGRVREWLARAVNAPRDPVWTADGIISDRWAPISPLTGTLDGFRWHVPEVATGTDSTAQSLEKMEEFVLLGVAPETEATAAPTIDADLIEDTIASSPEPAPTRPTAAPRGREAIVTIDISDKTSPAAPKPADPPAKPDPVRAAPATPAAGTSSSKAANAPPGYKVSDAVAPAAMKASPFVPPRPPDDPGLDDAGDEPGALGRAHRTIAAAGKS